MSQKILLIEDDQRLAEMVQDYLGEAGFDVVISGSGEDGLTRLAKGDIDAIILDLMLPGMDGLEVCQNVRATHQTPILMLTARGDAMDRIVGLELGADDYLPKPFEPRELQARMKAILRRGVPIAENDIRRFGRLEIDTGAREARLDGKACDLTAHQFGLLEVLSNAAGRVLSRDTLMETLRGHALEAFDRSIDVHISRIRAEIEDNPKNPQRVLTIRGAGYLFTKNQE